MRPAAESAWMTAAPLGASPTATTFAPNATFAAGVCVDSPAPHWPYEKSPPQKMVPTVERPQMCAAPTATSAHLPASAPCARRSGVPADEYAVVASVELLSSMPIGSGDAALPPQQYIAFVPARMPHVAYWPARTAIHEDAPCPGTITAAGSQAPAGVQNAREPVR